MYPSRAQFPIKCRDDGRKYCGIGMPFAMVEMSSLVISLEGTCFEIVNEIQANGIENNSRIELKVLSHLWTGDWNRKNW